MTWELDEVYVESQYLMYQVGIEDGTVLAVVLWIVESLFEVEVFLSIKLLVVSGILEAILYEVQYLVGCLLLRFQRLLSLLQIS